MIIAQRYTIERVADTGSYKIHNHDAPLCPVCGLLCSGYDTRSRHTIDGAGVVRWFVLRRLHCPGCKNLHIELPDFMKSKKHYEAQVITGALSDRLGDCPADDSTIRRWRRENHPPGLPVSDSGKKNGVVFMREVETGDAKSYINSAFITDEEVRETLLRLTDGYFKELRQGLKPWEV